ncbi:methyltransferase domain-containing protein [Deinococcus misasensis]|uniref:methyltransferase domain-containing protein n=1 Tax=Deinococcus misasensis TaxID=392413 RepID=UPI000555E26B|nr:methyltransferase domain-containing protein [Deinococcus misasensis]
MQNLNVPERWTFENHDVARAFDDHVREQLPWYDLVTSGITHLARHYATEHSVIYDIGASTGNISRALTPTVQERKATLIAIEPSHAMREQFHAQAQLIVKPAEEVTYQPFSVAILNLTLQFIQPQNRGPLLEELKAKLQPGGAIILVDKFEPPAGYAATALYRLTLAGKLAAGATPEAIIKKELSLGGVQRPLKHSDFQDWVPWFRFGDFAGYLFEK